MHRRRGQAAWVVAALAFVVFLPSLGTTFIYDDIQLITRNEYIHSLHWLPRAFMTHFWDVGAVAQAADLGGAAEATRRYYRPLVTASFLLTWVVVGARAWAYHLVNVLLHAGAAGLATRSAIRWTGSLALGFLAGALFAVHPTRTENVIWIAGRSDLMMMFFLLLGLEGFRRFERSGTWWSFAGGLLAMAAAILSKEPGALLPLLLLARDRGRPSRVVLGATVLTSALYGIFRVFLWRAESDTVHAFTPLLGLETVGAYVHRTLLPWPPTMYYEAGSPKVLAAVGGLAMLATLAALVGAWRRSRAAFWLLVAAIAFLAPVLNFSGAALRSAVQDRFLYASLLFGAAGVARLFRDRLRHAVRDRKFRLAAAGVGAGAVALVLLRTPDYSSEDAFWRAELAHHPDDGRAYHMLAQNAATRGDLEGALDDFRRARRNDKLRRQQDVIFVMSHFEEASVLGATLPDGRVDDLRALRDEMHRVVDPSSVPARTDVLTFPVGADLPARALAQQHELGTYFWDAALLATRTGDLRGADDIVREVSSARTAAHPFNSALVLARIGRIADARALVAKLRGTAALDDLATANEERALLGRLEEAERLAAARDGATGSERAAYEAARLAGLGAYWCALRTLVQSGAAETQDVAQLTLQLLVACRLDVAAHEFARLHFGADGPALTSKLEAGLPQELRGMEPVPTHLDAVFAAAKQ